MHSMFLQPLVQDGEFSGTCLNKIYDPIINTLIKSWWSWFFYWSSTFWITTSENHISTARPFSSVMCLSKCIHHYCPIAAAIDLVLIESLLFIRSSKGLLRCRYQSWHILATSSLALMEQTTATSLHCSVCCSQVESEEEGSHSTCFRNENSEKMRKTPNRCVSLSSKVQSWCPKPCGVRSQGIINESQRRGLLVKSCWSAEHRRSSRGVRTATGAERRARRELRSMRLTVFNRRRLVTSLNAVMRTQNEYDTRTTHVL